MGRLGSGLVMVVAGATLLAGCATVTTYRDPATAAEHECSRRSWGTSWRDFFNLQDYLGSGDEYQACQRRAEARGWVREK
jgi:hypothetical protein